VCLLVLCGLPASGKTTTATALASYVNSKNGKGLLRLSVSEHLYLFGSPLLEYSVLDRCPDHGDSPQLRQIDAAGGTERLDV
jgi:Chromatin associated protein KTI12